MFSIKYVRYDEYTRLYECSNSFHALKKHTRVVSSDFTFVMKKKTQWVL